MEKFVLEEVAIKEFPFVSALLVTRNEEKYVKNALYSLLGQDYPKDRYEIIVVDGMSSDKTLDIVNQIKKEYSLPTISIYSNPKMNLAAGWNIGIKSSKGKYVVRIDAHAKALPDFISKSVKTIFEKTDVVCVGGKLITKSFDQDSHVVPMILSSPFGVGNSSFRVSNTPQYADTAVYGLYDKKIFDEVGYFNEQFKRSQDLEMHGRIKKHGGKFYFNPEIKCEYYSRSSVSKMLKQAFENGAWGTVLIRHDITSLHLRHLIPLCFVLFLVLTFGLGFIFDFFWKLEFAILVTHLICGVIASLKATHKIKEVTVMPFLFMLLHITYGIGYIKGLFIEI